MTLRRWFTATVGVIAIGSSALAAPPEHIKDADQALVVAFGPNVRVVRDGLSGAVRSLRGLSVEVQGATPAERALAFVNQWRNVLDLGHSDVTLLDVKALPGRGHVVRFQQVHSGVVVEGRSLAIKVGLDGHVDNVTSDIVPFELPTPASTISAEAAKAAVSNRFAVAMVGRPTKVVNVSAPHLARLAWRVPVAVIPLVAHFYVWVDAETGEILRQAPAGHDMPMTHLPLKVEAPR